MKLVWITLITLALAFNSMAVSVRQQASPDSDQQAARQLAIEFTKQFVSTTDLSTVTKNLFVHDFIERYTKSKTKKDSNPSPKLYFVPGLEYHSRLLVEASAEDWLRFYTATNNFMFFGIVSGIRNAKSANVAPTDLYPKSVINLLNTNPNLANMIVRKGASKPVGSVSEMQKATATLEQAVALMREQAKGQTPLNVDEKELAQAMQEDAFFRPKVETIDDEFFGLPRGTRIIFITTPVLFQLILVKTNDKWEILWAEPHTAG